MDRQTDRHTRLKTLPSATSLAGGNYHLSTEASVCSTKYADGSETTIFQGFVHGHFRFPARAMTTLNKEIT